LQSLRARIKNSYRIGRTTLSKTSATKEGEGEIHMSNWECSKCHQLYVAREWQEEKLNQERKTLSTEELADLELCPRCRAREKVNFT
jgi:rubredoxin